MCSTSISNIIYGISSGIFENDYKFNNKFIHLLKYYVIITIIITFLYNIILINGIFEINLWNNKTQSSILFMKTIGEILFICYLLLPVIFSLYMMI